MQDLLVDEVVVVLTGHEGVQLTFTAQVSSLPSGLTKQTLFCPVRPS